MTHQGQIILLSKEVEFITRRWYHSLTERNRIINMWVGLYGKALQGCFIQIVPCLNHLETDEKGINQKVYNLNKNGIGK